MSTIDFHKMHGLGNDFVIINGLAQTVDLSSQRIAQLADRHTGIGFDQLLWLQPSSTADLACLIFNADGSEAEQCGNGMRCVAHLVHQQKIILKNEFTIATKGALVKLVIEDADHIRTHFAVTYTQAAPLCISIDSTPLELTTVSLGNPHALCRVDRIATIPVNRWGAIITQQLFPQGVNIGFMEVVNPQLLRLRTYERGVGETYACGSNAGAAAVVGIAKGWLRSPVNIELALGTLIVDWHQDAAQVVLTGPARFVFSGKIDLSVFPAI